MIQPVHCADCGYENTADAKFCSQCGTSMGITCPVCSTVAEPGARFCSNCGASLQEESPVSTLTSQPEDLARYLPEELLSKLRSAKAGHAMQGERRTVTMVFADIQGSTSSAERLDPEDWAEIMNGAFEHLISPIYRYEGTLAQLRGDAVLAFFGAPIAHEDDPVRAIRAGLEIAEAMNAYSVEVDRTWGIPIHVRVGINTGLVVVGAMGSDLRVEYTALGDAINVAARMEQTAEPGNVRVTGHTLSLTGGAFEAEDLGPVEVKGKAEPVPAYRVLRHVGKSAEPVGLPIVGRDAELATLEDVRTRLVGGAGSITSIIADAGVGKSRLLDEFWRQTSTTVDLAERFDDEGDISWMSGWSRSYDSGNPFSTIADLLKRWWAGSESEPGLEVVESSVAAAGIDDADTVAYLSYLAGVPLSPSASSFIDALEAPVLNARAGEALARYLEGVAAKRPVFMMLEDLHWADDLSLALTEVIMDLTERLPIGLVVAMRPYRDEPTWRIHEVAARDHHHRYVYLELTPLQQSDSILLLEVLLEETALTEDTKRRVLERSEGNPLYLEEMVRSIREVGPEQADQVTVPSSLTGTLTARLDRLEEQSRYVAQLASVLGSEFEREMLSVLLGHSEDREITDLLRRGILVETPGKAGSLTFRHALIQEAAYETILRRTRRDLHRRVADRLIERGSDAPQEIARHLVEARDVDDAFPYLIEAGRKAARAMALADAIRLLTTAVENTPQDADPELVERAHESLGEAYALVPDLSQASAAYQRLYEYGEESERPAARVAALNRLAYATATIGADLEGAGAYLEDARRIAEEAGDDLGMAEYHMNACLVASLAGEPGKAAAHDEATVALGEKAGVGSILMAGLVRRAVNYTSVVDLDEAIPAIDVALEEARGAGMEEAVGIVQSFGLAQVRLLEGDIRGSLEVAEEAQRVLARFGSFYEAPNQRNIGMRLYDLGNLEDALARFVETRRLAGGNQSFVAAVGASGMALVYATAGMADEIPRLRAETEELLAGPMGEFMASTAWADLGWTNLLTGRPDLAEADFTFGLGASSTTRYYERPRLLAGLARAQMMQGDLTGAEEAMAESRAMIEEKSMVVFEALVDLLEGIILTKRRDLDAAHEKLVEAYQRAMDTGQRLLGIEILHARAQLALALGDETAAAAHARAATEAISAIADSIADEALEESYKAKWLEAVGTGSSTT